MTLQFFGVKDLIFLIGIFLGFTGAFLLPKRQQVYSGEVNKLKGPLVPSLASGVIILGLVLLFLSLLTKLNLRWAVNTIGLLALGGIILFEYKNLSKAVLVREQLTKPVVVTPRQPSQTGMLNLQTISPPPISSPLPKKETEEMMKVTCPGCGRIIEVKKGSIWIRCPYCGLKGRIG